jgi:hypothetical protein
MRFETVSSLVKTPSFATVKAESSPGGPAYCRLSTAFCFLPSAFCLLPSAFRLPAGTGRSIVLNR